MSTPEIKEDDFTVDPSSGLGQFTINGIKEDETFDNQYAAMGSLEDRWCERESNPRKISNRQKQNLLSLVKNSGLSYKPPVPKNLEARSMMLTRVLNS